MPALSVTVDAGQLTHAPTSSTATTPVVDVDAAQEDVAAVGLDGRADRLDRPSRRLLQHARVLRGAPWSSPPRRSNGATSGCSRLVESPPVTTPLRRRAVLAATAPAWPRPRWSSPHPRRRARRWGAARPALAARLHRRRHHASAPPVPAPPGRHPDRPGPDFARPDAQVRARAEAPRRRRRWSRDASPAWCCSHGPRRRDRGPRHATPPTSHPSPCSSLCWVGLPIVCLLAGDVMRRLDPFPVAAVLRVPVADGSAQPPCVDRGRAASPPSPGTCSPTTGRGSPDALAVFLLAYASRRWPAPPVGPGVGRRRRGVRRPLAAVAASAVAAARGARPCAQRHRDRVVWLGGTVRRVLQHALLGRRPRHEHRLDPHAAQHGRPAVDQRHRGRRAPVARRASRSRAGCRR